MSQAHRRKKNRTKKKFLRYGFISPPERDQETRNLKAAIFLTAGGMLIEFAGGYISNSIALISDAVHMLTHLFALLTTFFAAHISKKAPTKAHSYGFYRIEIFAALINSILLFIMAAAIIYESVDRFYSPLEIRSGEMFFIAVFGLIINLASVYLLHTPTDKSLNVESAIFHLLGDTLSSVAIVAVAVIIEYTGLIILDPLISILITLLILNWAFRLIKDSAYILLESTPKGIDVEHVAKTVKSAIEEVREIHDIHIWELTSNVRAMTAHVCVEDMPISKTAQIIEKINSVLYDNFGINHTNIQIECSERDWCSHKNIGGS